MKKWMTGGSTITALVSLISLLNSIAGLAAGPVVQAWVQRYDGPAYQSGSCAVAVDQTNGNVYVTGCTIGTNHSPSYATIGYSSHGVALWTNIYGGVRDYAVARAIAADSRNGNVYVAGEASGAIGWDFATVAYSSAGEALWTNRYRSPALLYAGAGAIAVGASGNVYVAGNISDGDNGTYVTVAYTSEGTSLWTNFYKHSAFASAGSKAMAVDAEDNVYVTGSSHTGFVESAIATVAYSGLGAPLWTNYNTLAPLPPYGGFANATAIAVDSLNRRVYVTGYAEGTGTGYDCATIAYATDGTAVWTNRYAEPGSTTERGNAVAVDKNGTVYVTGATATGWVTLAYSIAGTPLWTNQCNGVGRALAVDACGNVVVAGNLGSYPDDFLIVASSSTGAVLWSNRYDGSASGDDSLSGNYCVAAGPDGGVYLTGASETLHGGFTDYSCVTIKYMAAPDIRLKELKLLPGATSLLTLEAPTNAGYRLEASSNLIDWLILTNCFNLSTSSIQYTDALAAGSLARFYRAVWVP